MPPASEPFALESGATGAPEDELADVYNDPLKHLQRQSSGGFLKDVATAYTTETPEEAQIVNPFATLPARQFDAIPGSGVRRPQEGPTDMANDRRGPVDTLFDTVIERPEGFEDRVDFAGPSVGEVATPDTIPDRQRPGGESSFDTADDGTGPGDVAGAGVIGVVVVIGLLIAVGQVLTLNVGVGE
jgi:hypothetical protein